MTVTGNRPKKILAKHVGYFVDDDGGFQKAMDYWIGAMAFTPDAKLLDHREP